MRGQRSIRQRLLVTLISTIVLVWLAVSVLIYRAAGHEVEEVFDGSLVRNAQILQALLLHEVEEEGEVLERIQEVTRELGDGWQARSPRLAEIVDEYLQEGGKEHLELIDVVKEVDHRYGAALAFIARHADGSVMLRTHSAPDIPLTATGFADVRVDDHAWRAYSLRDSENGFVVQVVERQAYRDELVDYITRHTLMPLLLALPVIGLLIWYLVGHALMPLRRIADEVALRAPNALEPIDDGDAPREIHGLLGALNRLFDRLASAMLRERQFTADAAHELRTPLAGLKTHLQVARARLDDTQALHAIDQALDGVDRATHSVEQLLLLARADAQRARALLSASADLRELAVWAVSIYSQPAIQQGIDLGVDAAETIEVRGDINALQVMIRNLVDNALRYTPRGGTVTVRIGRAPGRAWIAVADDGVGVPVAERDKIFDRFHRGAEEQSRGTTGSGLGLSIVKRIVQLHGADIQLADGLHGGGLEVRVAFPVDPTPQGV